jgi:AhpD family alkylhydroperoxidase
MTPRLNLFATPALVKPLLDMSQAVAANGLEASLLELVKLRASQINGCAYCLDMHARDARKLGESEERIYMLDAWRESPLYSDRERAALAWTESLTLVAATRAPDDVYEMVKAAFSDEEQVKLTMAIVMINSWNRLNVAFRTIPAAQARKAA